MENFDKVQITATTEWVREMLKFFKASYSSEKKLWIIWSYFIDSIDQHKIRNCLTGWIDSSFTIKLFKLWSFYFCKLYHQQIGSQK